MVRPLICAMAILLVLSVELAPDCRAADLAEAAKVLQEATQAAATIAK